MTMLEGSVIYIDDEWNKDGSTAGRFYKQLWESGRPMRAYNSLPPDGHLDHWDGLSMVILDWNLLESDTRVEGASELQESAREEILNFLTTLLKRYFCPVFIVSASDKAGIEAILRDAEVFPTDALGPRVRVVHKHDVSNQLLPALEEEVAKDPVLSALAVWEREYQRAKNEMFIDFSKMSAHWPAYIVDLTEGEGADAAYELVETLNANLRHRMNPVAFDLERLRVNEGSANPSTLRRVTRARTMLRPEVLNERMVYPGDLFRFPNSKSGEIWMNISPVCQTIVRPLGSSGKEGTAQPARSAIRLHLIRGELAGEIPLSRRKFSDLRRRGDGPNGAVIHALIDECPYYFEFGRARIRKWEKLKDSRIGRVLPPYITRLQQKHAAYIQSEGLPPVDYTLYQGELPDTEAG